jgi:hypothetical protein
MVVVLAAQILDPYDGFMRETRDTFDAMQRKIGVEGLTQLKSGKHVAIIMAAMASTLGVPHRDSVTAQAERVALSETQEGLQTTLTSGEFIGAIQMLRTAAGTPTEFYEQGITLLVEAMENPQKIQIDPRLAEARKQVPRTGKSIK